LNIPPSDLRGFEQPAQPVRISDDGALMARTFAYLYAFGGLMVAVTLVLPASPDRHALPIAGVSVVAFMVAALCLWRERILPVEFFRALPLAGVLLIAVLLFSGGSMASGAYALFSIWVTVSAFYFFHPAYGVLCTGLASACYLVALLIGPHDGLIELDWVMMTGALFVAGVLVGRLRSRVEVLVDELGAAARTDPLTGLANRREFASRLREEIFRANRDGSTLSVIALDLDGLKTINDRSGHQAGDRVLERIGAALLRQCRAVDRLARIGGDEFAIIAAGAGQDEAQVLSQRLQWALEEEFHADSTAVTMSVGIASHPDHARDLEALQEAADQALYTAKRRGGDCVVGFSPVIAEEFKFAELRARAP